MKGKKQSSKQDFSVMMLQRENEEKKEKKKKKKTASVSIYSRVSIIFVLCKSNYENAQFNTEERREKKTLFQSFNCALGRRRVNEWKIISVAINYMYIETTAMKKQQSRKVMYVHRATNSHQMQVQFYFFFILQHQQQQQQQHHKSLNV